MSPQPKKVLIVTPSSRLLGARRSLLALAEGLDRSRWEPIICGQSYGQLGEAATERGIHFEVVKLGWWRKGKYFLWRPFAIARLAGLARLHQVSLIHCNEIYPNPYAIRAAASVSIPGYEEMAPKPTVPVITHMRLGMKPGMIQKYDLGRADKIVVVSKSAGEDFDEWKEKKDERVRVVYNGVNLEEFQRQRSAAEARRKLGIPAEGLVIVAVGQVGPRKGGDLLLEAFEGLATQFPQAQLVFVGDPHKGQEEFQEILKRRAEAGAATGRVHFYPFTPEILPFYEAADLNVLYSRSEGFGRTVIEAGAVGVPTLGADRGGIAEIIVDGVSGRLAEAENAAALERVLGEMMSNDTARRELAEGAFRRTAQYFSINAHVETMMDLYDEVLENRLQSG